MQKYSQFTYLGDKKGHHKAHFLRILEQNKHQCKLGKHNSISNSVSL